MPTILVTGANGFIGRAVCARFSSAGWSVRAAVRDAVDPARLPAGVSQVVVGSIGASTDWGPAVDGAQAIVHLAARVHVMNDRAADPLSLYREVNVQGTERLARAAAAAGVGRLVYLSSIKVNGEVSPRPYRDDDPPKPGDPYGVSKWEAEQAAARVAAGTRLQVAVLRPPLVYGPGVRANFLSLLAWVAREVPLPLGSVDNSRSLLFVDNLADAVAACVEHPRAAGRTFLISDGEDVSTPELIRMTARALGRKARLFPCPPALLRAAACLAGRGAAADRLLGSLTVDSSGIRESLSWRAPFHLSEGLAATAAWYAGRGGGVS